MRLFRCQNCGQTVFFENTQCERCGHSLGYLPEIGLMSALEPEIGPELRRVLQESDLLRTAGLGGVETWLATVRPGLRYRRCANAALGACNWMVPADSSGRYCLACRHNRRVANLRSEENLGRWRRLELAKHRLFYSLIKLELPLPTRDEAAEGLAFDFLADPADPAAPRVITGHAKGLITIALREADDVERERMRKSMGEPYRTTLGHFRHESGHYFWARLGRDGGRLAECRAVFGDERADYAAALRAHYAKPPKPGWQARFISAYATMHPWEDFAETWAHYLHMLDTLETAFAHGLELHPSLERQLGATRVSFDPYRAAAFDRIIATWLPLSAVANDLNRSMGLPDLYPFVLTAPVVAKLAFIHGLIQEHRQDTFGQESAPRNFG